MPWFPEPHVLNMSVNCKIFWTRFWILLTRLRIYTRDTVSGKKRFFDPGSVYESVFVVWWISSVDRFRFLSNTNSITCFTRILIWDLSWHKFSRLKLKKKTFAHMHDEENNLIQFLWCVQIMENEMLRNSSSYHILWRDFSECSECVQIVEHPRFAKQNFFRLTNAHDEIISTTY